MKTENQITVSLLESEVELLKEALDHLPSKDLSTNMMIDLLWVALTDKDSPEREKVIAQRESDRKDQSAKEEQIKIKCDVLRSKLILAQSANASS